MLGYLILTLTLFFFFQFYFYFWLCWVFVAVCGLSLVAVSGGHSSLGCAGFSLRWLLLLWSMGSGHAGFSSCGTRLSSCGLRAPERRLSSCGARGLVAPWHVRSSRTRDRTRIPCTGRWILKHCVTREVPWHQLLKAWKSNTLSNFKQKLTQALK